MAAMTTSEQHEPGDRFAAGRSFPTTLPAPGAGGGVELGEPVELHSREPRPWPAPADAPAAAPPVVASGPGIGSDGCCGGPAGQGDPRRT